MAINFVLNNINMQDINFLMCGYEKCSPEHFYGPAIRSYYLFHYILSGEGVFEANSKKYNLKAGQGFLICPQHTTFYKADKKNPWEYLWVGFEGTRANQFLNQANLSQDTPVFMLDNNSVPHNNFMQIYEYIKNSSTNGLILLGCLYNILGGLAQKSESSITRPQIYVNRAIDYINANYHLPITVESLAKDIGIDRKYFCVLFKKHTGFSPIQYILKIKVSKACELLKNTSSSVSDISRSVGYEDLFSFSRMFKRHTGVSPSQYRNI